jgi:hypothetical protein
VGNSLKTAPKTLPNLGTVGLHRAQTIPSEGTVGTTTNCSLTERIVSLSKGQSFAIGYRFLGAFKSPQHHGTSGEISLGYFPKGLRVSSQQMLMRAHSRPNVTLIWGGAFRQAPKVLRNLFTCSCESNSALDGGIGLSGCRSWGTQISSN